MASEPGPGVEYYESDFEWLSHVLATFEAQSAEDDLKREMEEGDGSGDGRTAISARARDMGSLSEALEWYYGQSSEVDKELEALDRFRTERESVKQQQQQQRRRHRRQSLREGPEESSVKQTSPEKPDEQEFMSRAWDKFYCLHENKFFKERRYLLKLFPELAKPGVCVLEVGAGHGSASLAILKQNPAAKVFAIDTSAKAVSILQNSLQKQYPDRFQAHHCDPTRESLPSSIIGVCQVALCCFVLSAIPAGRLEAMLQRITNALAPFSKGDAFVLIRDYALFDMRMFKAIRNSMDNPWWKVPVTESNKLVCNAIISDENSGEDAKSETWNAATSYRLLAPRTCLRQDGTLCLFFTPTVLRLLLSNSGCEVVDASLCCVNPPPGQHRIYINARGIRKSQAL